MRKSSASVIKGLIASSVLITELMMAHSAGAVNRVMNLKSMVQDSETRLLLLLEKPPRYSLKPISLNLAE